MPRSFKRSNVRSNRASRYIRGRKRRPLRRSYPKFRVKSRSSNYAPRSRKAKPVRVSAPSTVVAQTYHSNKVYPIMRSLAKKYSKMSQNFYTITEGNTFTAGSGTQYRGGNTMMTASQMRAALVAIGEQPGNANGSLTDTNRIFWKTAERYTTLTNSSNCTAFVSIYHFSTRRDTNNGLVTLWQQGINDMAQQTAVDYSTQLGIGPRMSQALNDYFKLKKVYQIVLSPGQSHQHNTKQNVYRIVNNDIIATDMQPNTNLAGITTFMLYVIRGAPVTDTNNATLVNTGPVKVDMVSTYRCSMTYMADNDANFFSGTGTGMAAQGNSTTVVNTLNTQAWNATVGQTGYQASAGVPTTTV